MPESQSQESTLQVPQAAPGGGRSFRQRLVRLILVIFGLLALGTGSVVGLFVYYGRDLPTFAALADYRPPQVSRIYDRQGRPAGEFFHERRTVVPKEKIPKLLKQAVVAAEDANFYNHRGLDYFGIARALFQDVRHMRLAQGASTITQQVVKNMILTPERKLARKVKEAILSQRLEQNLTKEDILWLYLNHIYFGDLRYGVEEAAQYFFGKSVDKLSLGEAALLAGLPQSPQRLNPRRHPERAKTRQSYVLRQMAENGFITRAQAEAEIARPIACVPEPPPAPGAYYAEEVRKSLVERYGEQLVYEGGLRVEVGMDRELQAEADKALHAGLEEVDHRFGLRAPELTLPAGAVEKLRSRIFGGDRAAAAVAWDFSRVRERDLSPAAGEKIEAIEGPQPPGDEAPKSHLERLVEEKLLEPGATLVAPVLSASDDAVLFDLGAHQGVIPFERMKWARPYSPDQWTNPPKKASEVLSTGQLVRVRVLEVPKSLAAPAGKGSPPAEKVQLELAPVPLVQGALVSIDPQTREVVALAGGYDFAASSFNRATQAHRQPGSSFKPFVYAAALASGKYTVASILNDAPFVSHDAAKPWNVHNFERDAFEGPMDLREALAKSKNTVSVRLIEAVGVQAVIDMAARAGIASKIPEYPSIALGTAEVTPLELCNAYATVDALGKRAEPILIVRVSDASGKVLEEHHAVPEETIPPAVAHVLTSMMQSVIEMGTGIGASELHRPIAGKTGTTSDNGDTWFSAFSPDLVATVWVGFDKPGQKLGRRETGGTTSLPIWLRYMKAALDSRPRLEFPVPPGVESVRIDPRSGLRAVDGAPGRSEVFVEGTAPKDFAPRPGEASPGMLFLEDGGRGRP